MVCQSRNMLTLFGHSQSTKVQLLLQSRGTKEQSKKVRTYSDQAWIVENMDCIIQHINGTLTDPRKPLDRLFNRSGACRTCDANHREQGLRLRAIYMPCFRRRTFRVLRHRRIARPGWHVTPAVIANATHSSKFSYRVFFSGKLVSYLKLGRRRRHGACTLGKLDSFLITFG